MKNDDENDANDDDDNDEDVDKAENDGEDDGRGLLWASPTDKRINKHKHTHLISMGHVASHWSKMTLFQLW